MDQAEQLRKLVRQQNAHKGCSRVITITSGKGGVGKSSTSVNLAVEMTRLGKKSLYLMLTLDLLILRLCLVYDQSTIWQT